MQQFVLNKAACSINHRGNVASRMRIVLSLSLSSFCTNNYSCKKALIANAFLVFDAAAVLLSCVQSEKRKRFSSAEIYLCDVNGERLLARDGRVKA